MVSEIALTWASLGIVLGAFGIYLQGLQHAAAGGRSLATLGFVAIVALLLSGNVVYHFCRLGYLRRRRTHQPTPRDVLEAIYDRPAPCLSVLIPSYKEEERVLLQTLLSVALMEYPNKHVAVLLDDPPNSIGDNLAALQGARSLVGGLRDYFAERKHLICRRQSEFLGRLRDDRLDLAGEALHVAMLYEEIALWLDQWTHPASPPRSIDFNATFAPFGGINDSGFRVVLSGNSSWYRFLTGTNPLTIGSGHSLEGGLLAGYQVSLPRLSVIGTVGPAFTESDDEGVRRGLWGAKAALSAYALPSDETMAFGSVSYSTATSYLQAQAKAGVRLVSTFYIGPEAIFAWRKVVPGLNNVAETRLGGHISAVSLGPSKWAYREAGLIKKASAPAFMAEQIYT